MATRNSTEKSSKVQYNTSGGSVNDFYEGKSIFITGGTGFLGKAVIEKILFETNVDKLFLLIRQKDNESIHGRLSQMLRNPVFERLKETKPSALDKIIPVAGDIVVPDLGMKTEDVKILTEQVSVVFNMAASVLFDEPFRDSLNFNYEGTKRVLNLAHGMKRIESFVHVSSTYAYAFDGEQTIKETSYPPPENQAELEDFVAKYNDNEIETKKFIKRRANTYTYSKAMAEMYVIENHRSIPTCIIRPSIISSKKDAPLKGWLDNWFGATRTYYNIVHGWNRLMLGRGGYLLDMIPVDYVANLCIIAATKNDSSKNVPIFNSSSSGVNPVHWTFIADCLIEETVKHKLNTLPIPFVIFKKSTFLFSTWSFILQLLPARVADTWLWVTGRRPRYAKIQKKVIKHQTSLDFFTNNSWVIECDNARQLFASLSESDREKYPCDPKDIDWKPYLQDYLWGIERFLVNKNQKK